MTCFYYVLLTTLLLTLSCLFCVSEKKRKRVNPKSQLECLELELHAPSYDFLEEKPCPQPPVPAPRKRQLSSSECSTTTMETVSDIDTDSDARDPTCDREASLTITTERSGKRDVSDTTLTPKQLSFNESPMTSLPDFSVRTETVSTTTSTGSQRIVSVPPLLNPKDQLKAKITMYSENLGKAIGEDPKFLIDSIVPVIMRANTHYPGGMVAYLHQCGLFHSQNTQVETQENGDLKVTVPWGNLDLYQLLHK